jgi:TPR repeat protein
MRLGVLLTLGIGFCGASGCASVMDWANKPESNQLPNGRCRNPSDPTTTIECKQTPPPIAAQAPAPSSVEAGSSTNLPADVQRLRSRVEEAQRAARAALQLAPGDETTKEHADRALAEIEDRALNEADVSGIEFESRRAVEAAQTAKNDRVAAVQAQSAREAQERKAAISAAGNKCWADIAECERLCVTQKDPYLCTSLALAHYNGAGGASIDAKKSEALFDMVCNEMGEKIGCDGKRGVERFQAECDEEDCKRGCDGGFGRACTTLARILSDRSDPSGALRRFKQACDSDATGCNEVGYVLFKGAGVRRDVSTALHYFERGCKGGNQDACDGSFGAKCYLKNHTAARIRADRTRYCPRGMTAFQTAVASNQDSCDQSMAAAGCIIMPYQTNDERSVYCCE